MSSVLMFHKAIQARAFTRWAIALSDQGVKAATFCVEEMGRWVLEADARKVPDDVLAFTRRRSVKDPEVLRAEAAVVIDATTRLIDTYEPDAVFVWGHSEHYFRAVVHVCREVGTPVLSMEGAMFPLLRNLEKRTSGGIGREARMITGGSAYYEPCPAIDDTWAHWADEPLTDEGQFQVTTYHDAWRRNAASKYAQPENTIHYELGGGTKVVFVPLQIDHDASRFYCTDYYHLSGADVLRTLGETLDYERWHIIAKVHPQDPDKGAAAKEVADHHRHIHVVGGISIHNLLQQSHAVIGVNSTVLMESLFYDFKPVSLGSACFTGRGFTHDVRSEDELRRLLTGGNWPMCFRLSEAEKVCWTRFFRMLMWGGNGGNGFIVDVEDFQADALLEAAR